MAEGAYGFALVTATLLRTPAGPVGPAGDRVDHMLRLHVHPLPVIDYITPQLIPAGGGVRLTLVGRFLGPTLAAHHCCDGSNASYVSSIFLGPELCDDVRLLPQPATASDQVVTASDSEASEPVTQAASSQPSSPSDQVAQISGQWSLSCLPHAGLGAAAVQLVVEERPGTGPTIVRLAAAAHPVLRVGLIYGGSRPNRGGYVAAGPAGPADNAPETPGADVLALASLTLETSGPVWALGRLGGKVVLGGAFREAGFPPLPVGYIAAWAGGATAVPLGRGVDAPVYALATWAGGLAVGGAFGWAFGADGLALRSGGLALWHESPGSGWSLLGGRAWVGALVRAFAINGTHLAAVGRMGPLNLEGPSQSCAGSSAALALLGPGGWVALGGADGAPALGGDAWAVAFAAGDLFVGGHLSLGSAAAQAAGGDGVGVARWDGARWWPLFAVTAHETVRGLALANGAILAGGLLGSTCGGTAGGAGPNLVKLEAGSCRAVGSGLNAEVTAVHWAESDDCLYVGGSFTGPGSATAERSGQAHPAPPQYAARLCDGPDLAGGLAGQAVGLDGMLQLGPVLAIGSYLVV